MHWNRMRSPRGVLTLWAISLLFIGPNACNMLAGGAALGATGGAIASRDIRVRPGASVRVDFTRPLDIPLVLDRDAGTSWLRETEYLVGRIERKRGDTLWIDLSESRTATSRVRYPRRQAQVAVDQRGPGTSITVLANRPAYMVAGAAFGTVLAAGLVLIYCKFNQCLA